VATLALVAVGITAAQLHDHPAVLKGTTVKFSELAPMPAGTKPLVPAGFTSRSLRQA
jgi:hypothetical protein